KGVDEPFEVKLTRAIITIKSVRYVRGGDIGYIRITSFNEQTSDLLDEAVTNLTRQIGPSKLRGFILDLRNNPGGLLDQAIAVSDEFMDGRSEEHTSELQSRENLVCRLLLEKKKA